jgi:hypothetical protein
MLAFPLNYKASIVFSLTFLELFFKQEGRSWQSKDLLVLFYPEMDYAFSIQEFLQDYYY